MNTETPLTLATLRRVVDELCRLDPQPSSLAAVVAVLRRHCLGRLSVAQVAALLAAVAALVGDSGTEERGNAAKLTPRQLVARPVGLDV